MIFKCKMCGGTLEVNTGTSVAECPYCGAKQTLPKLDNERRANLYDRAGHFRRMSDFDKAMALYEQILNEDTTDAEAYWSIVLCRYGIEYVEDPMTHKRIPTVNRVQRTSVLADEDYKSALAYADGYQRELYEAEAKEIEEIQKGILAISEKEEPFDVFICYKETDANGERTRDSVLANDLYYELTKEGYKVFFSRITLEDKLGTAYEPYIFAALQSARVMVVVGTNAENFNAPWVKNEWSRYLALIRSGAKKTLIPAYRDMDPYDLPDAFSHLQAQDMSKLGFMQDLIRGIKKLLTSETKKAAAEHTTVVTNASAANTVEPLLERAFMFLEDGQWEDANAYCEKVLDQDPKNGKAYLGKLLAEMRVASIDGLTEKSVLTYGNSLNYEKASRYDSEIAERLKTILESQLAKVYQQAVERQEHAERADEYKKLAETFDEIANYQDATERAKECRERYRTLLQQEEEAKLESTYQMAKKKMTAEKMSGGLVEAAEMFRKLGNYRDSSAMVLRCKKMQRYIVYRIIGLMWLIALLAVAIFGAVNCYQSTPKAQLEWEENDTGVTITGVKDKSRNKLERDFIIPDTLGGKPVTAIGNGAFYWCTCLHSVKIPSTVKSIGSNAFYKCTNLESVNIPEGVTVIRENTFAYCEYLENIVIPASVTSIEENAFNKCYGGRLNAKFANTKGWEYRYARDDTYESIDTSKNISYELAQGSYVFRRKY